MYGCRLMRCVSVRLENSAAFDSQTCERAHSDGGALAESPFTAHAARVVTSLMVGALHVWQAVNASFASFLSGRFLPPPVPRPTRQLFLELYVPRGAGISVAMGTADGSFVGVILNTSTIELMVSSQPTCTLGPGPAADVWSSLQLSYAQATGLFTVRLQGVVVATHLVEPKSYFESFRCVGRAADEVEPVGVQCSVRLRSVYVD